MRTIKKIILHCSDSEFGDAATIDRWHKERGFDRIGYHYVILNGVRVAHSPYKPVDDGLLEPGRDESVIGAHCLGHNADSIGICIIGKMTFTPEQFKTAGILIKSLLKKYGLSSDDVYGHCEFDPGKTCPNIDMTAVRAALRSIEEHPISTEYKGA